MDVQRTPTDRTPLEASRRPRYAGLTHDRRIVLLALLSGLPGIAVALGFLWLGDVGPRARWMGSIGLVSAWLGTAWLLRERVVRPLQTLANMLHALREGDFSIRARVPRDGARDALSLTYLELNALEELLRDQRLGAVEASETLRKVLESVDVALFAFDDAHRLRLVNRAGETLLGQPADRLIDRTALQLRLDDALTGVTPRTLELSYPGGQGRWELRRSVVRQEGERLQLLVLSDLSRALREEERQAWKRIIRVLSHEINNSLAPIKSISGSLRSLLERETRPDDFDEDVGRGLHVIQSRAESLGRFMATYAKLARLPEPTLVEVHVEVLVPRVAGLETRLPVRVTGGPRVRVHVDPDQIEQVLVNLIRNAVDASLEDGHQEWDQVTVRWEVEGERLLLFVEDTGPGVAEATNLFVPFYTTKPGGSGIGLALSRQIVEGHGGTLELENRPEGERGARARIELPLHATD